MIYSWVPRQRRRVLVPQGAARDVESHTPDASGREEAMRDDVGATRGAPALMACIHVNGSGGP